MTDNYTSSLIAAIKEELDATIHHAQHSNEPGLTYVEGMMMAIAIVRKYEATRQHEARQPMEEMVERVVEAIEPILLESAKTWQLNTDEVAKAAIAAMNMGDVAVKSTADCGYSENEVRGGAASPTNASDTLNDCRKVWEAGCNSVHDEQDWESFKSGWLCREARIAPNEKYEITSDFVSLGLKKAASSEIRVIDGLHDHLHEFIVKAIRSDYVTYSDNPAYSFDIIASRILEILDPYLRKREVGKAKRIKFSLEYLHNMLDRRLSHESEAAAAWCDDLLDHVKALQQIYEIEGQNT